jgi:hypothetical protein
MILMLGFLGLSVFVDRMYAIGVIGSGFAVAMAIATHYDIENPSSGDDD